MYTECFVLCLFSTGGNSSDILLYIYRVFCMCLISTGRNSSDIFVLYTDCFVCVCFLRVAIQLIF